MKDIFTRSKLNPILRPKKGGWWKVYNPGAAVDEQGNVHLFPRVIKKEKDWHSRIAHAVSKDGEKFIWDKKLALVRKGKSELRGVEDPRVTKIGDTYHMAFAAYDGKNVQLHTAITKNLNGPWKRQGKAVPQFNFFKSGGKMFGWKDGKPFEKTKSKRGKKWSKSGAFFPEKINKKYIIAFGEYDIWLATSKNGKKFKVISKPFLKPRTGTTYFDNTFIEMGPPPILTDKGWLLLYHGIDEAFRYQLGFVMLDKKNPAKILYRSKEPIFGPKEKYEIGDALIDVV